MLQTNTHELSLPESAIVGQTYSFRWPGDEDRSQPSDAGRDYGREPDPIKPWEPANEYSDRMHDPAGNSGAVSDDRRDTWDQL